MRVQERVTDCLSQKRGTTFVPSCFIPGNDARAPALKSLSSAAAMFSEERGLSGAAAPRPRLSVESNKHGALSGTHAALQSVVRYGNAADYGDNKLLFHDCPPWFAPHVQCSNGQRRTWLGSPFTWWRHMVENSYFQNIS